MKKRIISFILILVMAFGIFPSTAFANTVEGGICGEDLTWALDKTMGVLTVSGTGDMEDYEEVSNDAPWYRLNADIVSVEIANGVTSIGSNAFSLSENLKSVTISQSVTAIGSAAFAGCTSLKSIAIPDGVTSIGDYAFYNCQALSSLNIPKGATYIGKSAFEYCNKLSAVTIPGGVKNISDNAFSYSGVTSVTLSKGVETIGERAFSHSKITSITLPEGVTEIGEWAFSNTNLTTIRWPKSLTVIGENAFCNCDFLRNVYITDLAAWCKIDFSALYTHPFSHAFRSVEGGETGMGKLYLNNKLVTDLKIPDGVTSIGRSAFSRCDSITSVTIPDSVTSIGIGAFSNCSNLSSVTIPDGVTEIGNSAFSDCHQLKRIALPNKLTTITRYALFNNREVVYIPKGVKEIEKNAFGPSGVAFVYYGGSEADRKNLTVQDNNAGLEKATWVYNATGLPKETAKIFSDVKAATWYEHYVDYVYTYGIFTGTGKTTFSPSSNISRAQFVQVLANISGVDTSNKNVKSGFSDVPKGQWYTAAVKWAAEKGIVSGIGNGKFAPTVNVTREQMCVMLVNYATFKGVSLKAVESKASFADNSKISSWAKTAVYICQRADIVNGKGGNNFDPQGTGTRAEAAVMFTKFHKDY